MGIIEQWLGIALTVLVVGVPIASAVAAIQSIERNKS